MLKYILKRVVMAIATLFCILFILFVLLKLMPGSPFNNIERMSEEQLNMLYEKYKLNDPILIQFFTYVKNMFRGDLGVSYNIQANVPITTLIIDRYLITARIALQAVALGSFAGLVLGIWAALSHGKFFDSVATCLAVVGVSLPNFVIALLLQFFIAFKLHIFPIYFDKAQPFMSTVLPTIALCFFTLASIARYTRSELIEILETDYILLADAKGLPKVRIICVHAIKNALIGVITVLAPLIVGLLTGSLVIEKAFSIPGIGNLYVTAIQQNDYNIVLGLSFIFCAVYIGIMLIVDILYCVLDPRIRVTEKG